ncbi:MAG: CNP1-like family protein [Pseudomonadota bacterium]
MSTRKQLYALLGLLLISPLSPAKDRPFIDEHDNTIRNDLVEKKWKEGEISLPDQYEDKNLQEFQMDNPSGDFRYFIDGGSLQTSEDGVSRFTLVIRSKNGVDNSSYEGIRCGEREYRVYAYGSKQGFKMMPGSDWKHISKSGYENYRHVLYNDLICNTNTGEANPPVAVLRAMKHNAKAQNSPFIQD